MIVPIKATVSKQISSLFTFLFLLWSAITKLFSRFIYVIVTTPKSVLIRIPKPSSIVNFIAFHCDIYCLNVLFFSHRLGFRTVHLNTFVLLVFLI